MIKPTKGTIRYENPRFSVLQGEVYNTDNKQTMVRSAVVCKDAVCALVYNITTASFMFVSQFRYAAWISGQSDGNLTECVAGLIDEGSTLSNLYREIQEELGYDIINAEFVGKIFPSPGICTETINCYYVTTSEAKKITDKIGVESEGEYLKIINCSEKDLPRFMQTLRDGKTLYLCQWYLLNKRD
jgi:8-oxo-dGTP pyrophosphatase MutT (NUDIX family)